MTIVTKQAEKEYNELVELMLKVDEKRKTGWLLIDEDGHTNVYPIVLSSKFNDRCIAFNIGRSSVSTLIVFGSTGCFGKPNFLAEVRAARKFVEENYTMIEPKRIVKLSQL